MAWGKNPNMKPLESGGHGGGGSFFPSPGFPGGPPRTRPPGAAPTVPGGKKHFTIPKHFPKGNRSDPWADRRARENQRKAKLALKMGEGWYNTQGEVDPDSIPGAGINATIAGYNVVCVRSFNNCLGSGPLPWPWLFRTGAGSLSTAMCGLGDPVCVNVPLTSTWAQIQALPAPTSIVYGQKEGPFLDNFRKAWRRIAGTPIPWPQPMIGTIVLPMPDEETDPFFEPQFKPEKMYGAKVGVAVATHPGSRPAVDFGPSGPGKPGNHVPLPPAPGNREKKEGPFPHKGPLGDLYGAFTEAGDAAACYAEAKGAKPSRGTGARLRQAWALANDPDAPAFDFGAFQKCMTLAQAGDAAIGALSGGAAKAQNRSPYSPKRPGGYRGGGWGTRMH